MSGIKAVLFDVDGVLLDSLTPHLMICEDKNREYGLGLKIPDAAQLKEMVRRGTRISPMNYFFLAVGFPEELAEKAYLEYQRVFMDEYTPAPFPGVYQTLQALHQAGLRMGIVTSNFKANVVRGLRESIVFFDPECIYSKDSMNGGSKSQALASAMTTLRVGPGETLYVGDQPADWEAAKSVGANFLGVAYGWGISEKDENFPIAKEVSEIDRFVLGLSRRAPEKAVAGR